jgi:hypothetical protein
VCKEPYSSRESYIPAAGRWWLLALEGFHYNLDTPYSKSLDCISGCLCLGDSIPSIVEDRGNVDRCEVVVQFQGLELLAENPKGGTRVVTVVREVKESV